MRTIDVKIDQIYVPAKKRATLDDSKLEPLAEDILENGLQFPIYIREGKGRFVLQEGLHRMEAMKLLGEDKITANIVQARKY